MARKADIKPTDARTEAGTGVGEAHAVGEPPPTGSENRDDPGTLDSRRAASAGPPEPASASDGSSRLDSPAEAAAGRSLHTAGPAAAATPRAVRLPSSGVDRSPPEAPERTRREASNSAQTIYDEPLANKSRSVPRWILILAAAVAVVAIISYVFVGDREQVVTIDTLPQQVGPEIDPPPVTSPTPATPAPSPEPATPVQPPIPVQ